MILAALLAAPALAQPVSGAEKVGFADIFGWWLPVAGAGRHPAIIGLHGCDGPSARGELSTRELAMAELLRDRGYHVLLPEPCTVNIHRAIDWLAACGDVDRARIVVLGWSHGASALLAALQHRIGPMPLQARAAVAWTPKVMVRVLPGERPRRRDVRIPGTRIALSDPRVVRSRQSARHKFVCYPARAVKTTRSSQCKHKSCCPSWT